MDVEVSEATLVIYKHIHLLIRGGIEGVAGAEFSVPLLGKHTCLDLIYKHIHLLIRGGIEGVAGAEFSVPLLGTHNTRVSI